MTATIPGALDTSALDLLTGLDRARKQAFHVLPRDQQEQAIRRLAATGLTDYDVAAACGLAVEEIRRVLSFTNLRGAHERI